MKFKTNNYSVKNKEILFERSIIGTFNFELVGQLNEYKLAKINVDLKEWLLVEHFVNAIREITRHLIANEFVLKILYHLPKENSTVIELLKQAKYIYSKDIDTNIVEYKITKNLI